MRDEPEQGSVLDGAAEDWGAGLQQYRHRTVGILRKYLKISLSLGKLPSALGGEMFRSRVTGYQVASFEDMAIFVIDVAGSLSLLGEPARKFLALHVFQEHSLEDAAAKMGCEPRNGRRIYEDALGELSEIFLRVGVMKPSDWIGEVIAGEGWFEGCPLLRRNAWSVELPPKKSSSGVKQRVMQRVM